MDVLTTPAAMHAWSWTRRHHGRRIGLVPTMGALHAGHISLVGIAAAGTDDVGRVVFVNPLQFDRAADFEAYPRPIDADIERCDADRRRCRVRTDRGGDVPVRVPDPRRTRTASPT